MSGRERSPKMRACGVLLEFSLRALLFASNYATPFGCAFDSSPFPRAKFSAVANGERERSIEFTASDNRYHRAF